MLAGIFMVELERNLIPLFKDHLAGGRQYCIDTICFIKKGSVRIILYTLCNFHSSIKFTYEAESGCNLSFLDVLLVHTGNNIETCVCRKPTNPVIYLHWNSFAPFQWKYKTLKALIYLLILFAQIILLQHLESELTNLR